MFDQAISAKFSAAEKRMKDELAERGKAGEDRQALLDDLLAIVTDAAIASSTGASRSMRSNVTCSTHTRA
ncbi:hypothetical protein [Nocardia abscessus]|uniref:hypothetical protein n=1 Tax=Nocardia abscessus TaxID=120957 RepID=UPI00245490B1|nr:hypothetical protein [Nocardia abscessus]